MVALAGVPPFAGFWSKDEILAVARGHGWTGWLVWTSGVLTALVTAWYATRLWLRTFFGEPRTEPAGHPHEPRWEMLSPIDSRNGLVERRPRTGKRKTLATQTVWDRWRSSRVPLR